MHHRLNTLFFWALVPAFGLVPSQGAWAQDANILTGCSSESPPFVITKDGIGQSGFSVELMRRVAQQIGQEADIRELPWARCLNEVQAGRIDVAVDAFEDAERRKKFYYTSPYYTLTPQIFYPTRRRGPGLPATTVADLKGFRGCGIHGYTYEHYGLDEKQLDLGAKSNKQMITMLLANRCDYAVEELEYIMGGRSIEKDWPDETSLSSFTPQWAIRPKLHLLVGRSHRRAVKLVANLNNALAELEKSGTTRQLRQQYFPEASNPAKGDLKSSSKAPVPP